MMEERKRVFEKERERVCVRESKNIWKTVTNSNERICFSSNERERGE